MEALCKVEIPEVEGLNSGEMTVGRHLILNCESVPPSTDFTNVDFTKAQFKNEAPYTAKIFKAEAVSAANLKLDVTFYKTGDINLSDYILTDGVSEIKLSAEPIKVISVLKPREDGQPQQPYGPLFPIEIPVPTFYYVALVAVLLLTVLYSFFKAKRLAYYKKLKSKLSQYNSPIAPDTQFYKAVRQAEKHGYPLPEIEKAFRLYNLRAYSLPLFDLENDRVMRYFKRNFPAYKNTRNELQRLLGEFEEFAKKNEISIQEKNEFIQKLYRYVERHKGLGNRGLQNSGLQERQP